MYDKLFDIQSFDLIWFTGVLYHNPEQLRMISILYQLLKPEGFFVIESATTREKSLMDKNVVQIIYPFSEEYKKEFHLSANITHLPSKKAIWSWLSMIGFINIQESKCHIKQSMELAESRIAYIAMKPDLEVSAGTYYAFTDNPYKIGQGL